MSLQSRNGLSLLTGVVARIGHEAVTQWRALIAAGDWDGSVSRVLKTIMIQPTAARLRGGDIMTSTFEAPDLTPDTIDLMASKLLASVSAE